MLTLGEYHKSIKQHTVESMFYLLCTVTLLSLLSWLDWPSLFLFSSLPSSAEKQTYSYFLFHYATKSIKSENAHSLTGFVWIFKAGSCDPAALQAVERVLPPTCSGRILHPTHMSLHQCSRDLLLHSRKLLWEKKKYDVHVKTKHNPFWRLTASISYSQLLYTEKRRTFNTVSIFESN